MDYKTMYHVCSFKNVIFKKRYNASVLVFFIFGFGQTLFSFSPRESYSSETDHSFATFLNQEKGFILVPCASYHGFKEICCNEKTVLQFLGVVPWGCRKSIDSKTCVYSRCDYDVEMYQRYLRALTKTYQTYCLSVGKQPNANLLENIRWYAEINPWLLDQKEKNSVCCCVIS